MEPTVAERPVVKHSEYLKAARVVQSAARSVIHSNSSSTQPEVITDSGERVPFDFLVITTGSTYTGPSTEAERIKFYEDEKKNPFSSSEVDQWVLSLLARL